jgi:hypothetical protein
MNFHKKIIFGFILFFLTTLFLSFIWKVYGEYFHIEIIYYENKFENNYHFRSDDSYLEIHNLSDHNIYLQYKKYVYVIEPNAVDIFDVKGKSPVFIYKNKNEGMRSDISPYFKIIPKSFSW